MVPIAPAAIVFTLHAVRKAIHCKRSARIYVSNFDTLRGAWGNPEVLGEGINEGGSNTHPFVAQGR